MRSLLVSSALLAAASVADPAGSSALVTAVGHDNTYCTTIGCAFPTEIAMIAGCFDPGGVEVGSAFTAAMLTTAPR